MHALNPQALEIARKLAILNGTVDQDPAHLIFTFEQIAASALLKRFYLHNVNSVSLCSAEGLTVRGQLDTHSRREDIFVYFEAKFTWPNYNDKSEMVLRVLNDNMAPAAKLTMSFTQEGTKVTELIEEAGYETLGPGRPTFRDRICFIPEIKDCINQIAKQGHTFARTLVRA